MNQLINILNKEVPFLNEQKILIAISGGIDSVVLSYLLKQQNCIISLAHCNFSLRGDESDGDEYFVRKFASDLRIELFVKRFDTKAYADEKGISIQMAARELRYNWFEELMVEHNFDKLAVAHHADDNIETFIINFIRGSGLKGLKGIPLSYQKIIRPLLNVGRKDILQYANENELKYREDSSNKSLKYLRNNIRYKIIPELKNLLPEAEKSMFNSMNFLAADADMFSALLQEKLSEIVVKTRDGERIDIKYLEKLQPLDHWLFRLLQPKEFDFTSCKNLANCIINHESGKSFYSGNYKIETERNYLLIRKINEKEDDKEVYFILKDFELSKLPLNLSFELLKNDSTFKMEKNKNIAYFDADKLHFPLKLRRWQNGDRMKPFGLKGSKLLSDIFIDAKLSAREKENIWILESEGKILYVCGLRASSDYPINKSTINILKVKLSK